MDFPVVECSVLYLSSTTSKDILFQKSFSEILLWKNNSFPCRFTLSRTSKYLFCFSHVNKLSDWHWHRHWDWREKRFNLHCLVLIATVGVARSARWLMLFCSNVVAVVEIASHSCWAGTCYVRLSDRNGRVQVLSLLLLDNEEHHGRHNRLWECTDSTDLGVTAAADDAAGAESASHSRWQSRLPVRVPLLHRQPGSNLPGTAPYCCEPTRTSPTGFSDSAPVYMSVRPAWRHRSRGTGSDVVSLSSARRRHVTSKKQLHRQSHKHSASSRVIYASTMYHALQSTQLAAECSQWVSNLTQANYKSRVASQSFISPVTITE